MTDENLGESGLETGNVENTLQQPETPSAPENVSYQQNTAEPEKMIPQSEVNNMTAAVRRKSYDKGVEAGKAQNGLQANVDNSASVNESNSSNKGIDQSQMRDMINTQMAEYSNQQKAEAQKRHLDEVANQMVNKFVRDAEEAKKNIDGFDETMARVDLVTVAPGVFATASTLDNPAAVLHHLVANKVIDLASLEELSKKAPELVEFELKKISDRLKQNKNAKNSHAAPDPISQIDTDVRDGMGGAEPESIADFKSIYLG